MISIVIRNKNEAKALENILTILKNVYTDEIDEIILVDNNSTDNSISIAESFGCKVVTIDNFTYGKAINLGIESAKNNLILLLSSHAVPIGESFFKNSLTTFSSNNSLAGIRYINSHENYVRAIKNDFWVEDGLKFGLMAACAMVNKEVWKDFKFDENLVFSEDKEWSERVIKAGFKIKDLNETFFYHIKRDKKGNLSRWKNETIAHYQLHQLRFPSKIKLIAIFAKTLIIDLPVDFCKRIVLETKMLGVKLTMSNKIKTR